MTHWKYIQSEWKARETPYWEEHIRNSGINTWEQFRNPMIYTLKLNTRIWEVITLKDPLLELPSMYPNPLTRWTDFFGEKEFPRFSEIQNHPFLANHQRIREIADNFPAETTLITLVRGTKEIVIDGHHRNSAADLMYRENREFHSTVHVARTEISKIEWEQITKRNPRLLQELKFRKATSLIQAKIERILHLN